MARITFISRMTIKAGHEATFERIVKDLTMRVNAEERDIVYFEFFKLREPRRYAVLESFPNEEAEHAHMNGRLLAQVIQPIVDCVDGTWEREYLDALT